MPLSTSLLGWLQGEVQVHVSLEHLFFGLPTKHWSMQQLNHFLAEIILL